MNKQTFISYLNGLIIGIVFGVLLIFNSKILVAIYCSWKECQPPINPWWGRTLFVVGLGFLMAIFVGKYSLRD